MASAAETTNGAVPNLAFDRKDAPLLAQSHETDTTLDVTKR